MPHLRRAVVAVLAAVALAAGDSRLLSHQAPVDLDRGGNGLGLLLRRIGVTGRVLYVTAHPDDENNAVLVRLARGRGLRTALLTLTRGEGGQNAIGPEQGEALGILRTEELMAVHRWDGVEQYFGAAYEFGFSFSLEETLARWGREETLGDVVRTIRAFRPDVILTMPMESAAHQHHPASAQLAREAFRAAADPTRFKDQVESGLRPWQARKIYEGGVGGGPPEAAPRAKVTLETGTLDPLLGLSARQLGGRARAAHRSQVYTPLLADPGPSASDFLLVDAEPKVATAEADLFDGIDTGVRGLLDRARGEDADTSAIARGLEALEARIREANAAFDARDPGRAAHPLRAVLTAVRKVWDDVAQSRLSDGAREEILARLDDEERKAGQALTLASGISVEARLDDGAAVPGSTVGLAVLASNAGPDEATLESVEVEAPPGFTTSRTDGETGPLAPRGERRRVRYRVEVGAEAPPTRPYWRRMGAADRYETDATNAGLPWNRPDVLVRALVRVGGVPLRLETSAISRYEAFGVEKQHGLLVRPALSVRLAPELVLFPGPRRAREVEATVVNHAGTEAAAVVRLEAPAGFLVEPAQARVKIARRDEAATVRFRVTPPAGRSRFDERLTAVVEIGGRTFREAILTVAYPHTESRPRVVPAVARVLGTPVLTAPGAKIGYVPGSSGAGDPLPGSIRELGLPVTVLEGRALSDDDLRPFTTIVVGVRAYEVSPEARAAQARLMRYVEVGGHLLVLYQRHGWNGPVVDGKPGDSPFAPWPAAVTANRITDETAPLTRLVAGSPVLTTPNRWGPEDDAGWIQERAIQLLEPRDPRYVDLLAAADPFPKNAGEKRGILVETKVGRGTWTYTGLALFRQLPAGVPGAYRLWANLLSRPRPRPPATP